MDNLIIENLKILSEKFEHKFDTFSNSIIFISGINKIKIQFEDSKSFKITYNLYLSEKTVFISKEALYDFCLDLFKRQNDDTEVICNVGKIIEIEDWFEIEKKESLDIVDNIQKELDYNYRIKSLSLESPCFKATYFNGLLILEDKNKKYLSNVFNFKSVKTVFNNGIIDLKCRIENCNQHTLYQFHDKNIIALTAKWRSKQSTEGLWAGLLDESPTKNNNYELLIENPIKIDLNTNFWVVYFNPYATHEGIDSESDIDSMLFCLCRKISILEVGISKLKLEIEVLNVLDFDYSDQISVTNENAIFLDKEIDSQYYTITNFENFSKISINIQSDTGWTYIIETKNGKSKIVAQNYWDFHENTWKLVNEVLTLDQKKRYGITPLF